MSPAMDVDFTHAVEDGLRLNKRIQTGAAPRAVAAMDRSSQSLLPTSPMLYAVIGDPAIVDNPDIPSYQPHVYGRCDPPALIPLQMKEIAVGVDCYLDTAVVSVSGRWRVHCVMTSRCCDCRLVVPMGEQGSILGVEVEVGRKSYYTQMISSVEDQSAGKYQKLEGGGFLKPQLFCLTVPQVGGGCDISVKISWSQKLLYKDGEFSIRVPYNFPEYVASFSKVFVKQEKIQINVNSGIEKEILCQGTSHPLKEKGRHVGKLSFVYESQVENWSTRDILFSYSVYSSDLFGGVLLGSPTMYDYDQSDMFCLYLFPGSNKSRKVFRKEVVFIVDISESMQGKPLENVKNALSTALLELNPEDNFDIIVFNEEMYSFSSSLEQASEDMIESATQWMSKNFVAEGGTNIMRPLNEAMRLLSSTRDALPHIYLITDGAVEDERNICCTMRNDIAQRGSLSPRIFTFGVGSFCNHYFLKMLASIGRGRHDAAFDSDSIEARMLGWLRKASSPIVADISIDIAENLDTVEVYPFLIPDLSVGCPLVMSGRYQGKLPESFKAKGMLPDMTDIVIDLKVHSGKDAPLEKAFAKQQIDLLTAEAWFSESKQLEEKVTKLSMHSMVPSEYTYLVLLQSEEEKQEALKQGKKHEPLKQTDTKERVVTQVQGIALGFGNINATKENFPTGFGEPKPPESNAAFVKAVGCCTNLCDCCCCMCFISACSKMNNQCFLAFTQLCSGLACLACFECCSVCCEGGGD